MSDTPATISADLGFMNREGVAPDTRLPGGVLRAPTRVGRDDVYLVLEQHRCSLHDCAAEGIEAPELERTGFERIDLSRFTELQTIFERVRQAGFLSDADIKGIRRQLMGKTFRLANGKTGRILFIAGEGMIIRKSGPNGLIVTDNETMTANNGHTAAMAVHADQDVYGTPVRQLLMRLAPWIFRHQSPNGENRRSPVFLLNVWIPLQQITRPLAFMDQRTLNRREHQLRYALPVDTFLERGEEQQLNDIWTFLHDPSQQWYFDSSLDSQSAWAFNTLSCPHGSLILPGEALAEQYYQQLAAGITAIGRGDAAGLKRATEAIEATVPAETPTTLVRAIHEMASLAKEAHNNADGIVEHPQAWMDHARRAMDKVVRKSIEMRLVAWVS